MMAFAAYAHIAIFAAFRLIAAIFIDASQPPLSAILSASRGRHADAAAIRHFRLCFFAILPPPSRPSYASR